MCALYAPPPTVVKSEKVPINNQSLKTRGTEHVKMERKIILINLYIEQKFHEIW